MAKINRRKTGLAGISSILALCLLLGAGQALAGFVWTPPPAKPLAAPVPATTSTDGPAMSAVPVTPVDTANNMAGSMSGPDTLPLPPPSNPSSRPDNLATFLPPAPESKGGGAGDFIDLQGFGRDLPLHLVVKQVVQPGFTTSFAPGVDTSTLVSWSGGKPWNAVLQDALAPVNLQAAIKDRHVTIQPAGSRPMMAAAPPPPSPLINNTMNNDMNNDMNDSVTGAPLPLTAFKAPSPMPPSLPTALPSSAAAPVTPPGDDAIQWNTPAYASVTAPHDNNMPRDTAVAATPLAPPIGMRPGEISAAPMESIATTPADTAIVGARSAPINMMAAAAATPNAIPDSLPNEWAPPAAALNNDSAPVTAPVVDNTPGPDLSSVSHWQASKGDSLHTILGEWCARAGVILVWQAERDYEVRRAVDLKGDFPTAVTKLLTLYNDSRPCPTGKLHPHLPGGRAALIVGN